MTEYRGYVQRYAMQFGAYMGAFWIAKFMLFPLGLTSPLLLLLFMACTLCVPFISYYFLMKFRDGVCGGCISFSKAWIFNEFVYLYAAILTALGHYVYFQFVDNGYILNTYESVVSEFAKADIAGTEAYVQQIETALEVMRSFKPIEIAMQLMSNNVMVGGLLGVPLALFAMRKNPRQP